MIERKSLDKISSALKINKKTAFDWRHKILSSLPQDSGKDMSGIIESDETFFEKSEKGSKRLNHRGRKRGSAGTSRGIEGVETKTLFLLFSNHLRHLWWKD